MRLNVSKLRDVMQREGMTQTELAKRSGVSRGRISALLNKDGAQVREATERRLSEALGMPEGSLDRDRTEQHYLDLVAERHKDLDFTGLGIVYGGEPVPMDRGFVPLSVRPLRDERECPEDVVAALGTAPRVVKDPRRTFSLGAALGRGRRLCLLGDPGCGKTTALRHMARAYALRCQGGYRYPDRPLVPLLVRLPEWAQQLAEDGATDVVEAALAQLPEAASADTGEWLRKELAEGRGLVLLDGLDEVADPGARGLLIEGIHRIVNSMPKSRVVVTSRLVGFERTSLGGRFDLLEVAPLGEESVTGFVREWCAFRHRHTRDRKCAECEEASKRLIKTIATRPRIEALAGNPMMLTILVLLQEAGVSLPQRRWDLYERIAEAFLFSWQEKKRRARSGFPDRSLAIEDREVLWILESVALQMQRRDWVMVPRWWLAQHVSDFLRDEMTFEPDQARSAADALIWSLQERSGMFVERGPDRFGFSHLAFQEYFAAQAVLAEDDPIEFLRPHLYHPRWRQVVPLVASQMDRRRVPRLLRTVLDDPDPTGRFLERGLLLAWSCLTDGAALHDTDLLDELVDKTAALGRSKWLGFALEAIRYLGGLRGTRLEPWVGEATEALLRDANETLDPEEYTNLLWGTLLSRLLKPEDAEEAAEGGGPDEDELEPVAEKTIQVKNQSLVVIEIRFPGETEGEWLKKVQLLLTESSSPRVRAVCATELGRFASRKKEVRRVLAKALQEDPETSVREAVATGLRSATKFTAVRRLLAAYMDERSIEPQIRSACAVSLRGAAVRHEEVRSRLVSLVTSADEPPVVRGGAAAALSRCARTDNAVRDLLLHTLQDPEEDHRVRADCVYALQEVLPGHPSGVRSLTSALSGPGESLLTRVAAQVLAQYAATGQVDWSELPIERIEHVLVSLKTPCPHALDALRGLMDARERRRLGVPRATRIARAMSSLADRIRVMFVFGSAARGEQRADSDIDLMVIGDVRLRELTPGLKQAEAELGRQINPVVYSQQEWRERLRQGTPFVRSVVANEKEYIMGDKDVFAAMA